MLFYYEALRLSKELDDKKFLLSYADVYFNENILDDFKDLHKKKELTHGEALYLKYGFAGIRGEIKKGLENIFQEIIPKYKNSNLKGNDLYSETLLMLISKVEDSTIVHRQNIEKLREVQRRAYEILNLGSLKGFFHKLYIVTDVKF